MKSNFNFYDSDSNYTCTANDGASIVDYNIASGDLFPHVIYFNVENRDESLHFPLRCEFEFRSNTTETQAHVDLVETSSSKLRIRWKEDRGGPFCYSSVKSVNISTNLPISIHKKHIYGH